MAYQIYDISNVHVDIDLTNFAVAFGSNMGKFVASTLFPEVTVGKKSDTYPVFGKENYIAEDDTMGDRDHPKEVVRGFERRDYNCELHGRADFIGDADLTNADDAVRMAFDRMGTVQHLKELVLLNREVTVKTLLSTSGSYASPLYENMDTVAGRNFDDSGGAGALKILGEFIDAITDACGERPDTMLVSNDCWRYLSTDIAFFGGGAIAVTVTPAQMAEILGLARVIKAESVYSSGKPRSGGAVTTVRLWTSNSIWLTHSPPGITKLQPSLGKIFKWNAAPGFIEGEMVRTARDERAGVGGTWVDYLQHYVPKLTACDTSSHIISGAWLQNCYTAI